MLGNYIKSQWLMLVGLMVPLILLVSSISLASPIANAVAIPLITFLVVPILLLAAALSFLFPWVSQQLLVVSDLVLDVLLNLLQGMLNGFPVNANPVFSLTPAMTWAFGFCSILLLLPRGFVSRLFIGCVMLCLITVFTFLPKPNQPDLRLTVLDVGQGTAVVVEVGEKTLIYDTGARFSEKFDAGSGIIVPYLHSQARTRIDALVVSHNDQDHAGGLEGLMNQVAVEQLLLGQYSPIFTPDAHQARLYSSANKVSSCHEYSAWQWQKVKFQFIKWPLRYRAAANNYSCLLQITYHNDIILLPGDLEREVELQLLDAGDLPSNIQLLLAGHHGSQTSSTQEFVSHVNPRQVIYSAGYKNRYGHPHNLIQQRYKAIGAVELSTATQGALEFSWKNGVNLPVVRYREGYQRYWH